MRVYPPAALSRRRFIALSSGAAALALARPVLRAAPSAQVRVAVVGLRIKGYHHAADLLKDPRVRLAALCDVDPAVLAETKSKLGEGAAGCTAFTDYRRLLESPGIDAVVIATPNHLHTLQTLMALEAGKAVYVEKPVSHNIHEGRALLAALRARPRAIVQAGNQKRSDAGLREAFAALRAGELGRIRLARAICYRLRQPIGRASAPPAIPPGLDLDLFCGPAPLDLPVRSNFHYDWHWFWETGNGEIGNQCPHELDLARQAIGATGRPRRVLSFGARLGTRDDGETPNTHACLFEYPEAPVLLEVRGLPREAGLDAEDAYRGLRVGVVVECEQGWLAGGSFYDRDGKRIRKFATDGGASHLTNFIDSVLANDPARLNAPLSEVVPSTDLVHFGNIAHRVGSASTIDEIGERMAAHAPVVETLGRLREHLVANRLAPDTPLRLGGWLEWDETAGRFIGGVGHEATDALLGRDYRAPWTLPVLG